MRIKIYSSDKIRAMRTFLKEKRPKFADRFFLTVSAIKGWETKRRNVSGPALVILQQIEIEINIKKAQSRKILEEYRRGLSNK